VVLSVVLLEQRLALGERERVLLISRASRDMSFKRCTLILDIDRAAGPFLASKLPRLFEGAKDVFVPLSVSYAFDADSIASIARFREAAYGGDPLWQGEELAPGNPLSSCSPKIGRDLISELHEQFSDARHVLRWARAEGALLHVAGKSDAAAWYGRWMMRPTAIHEIFILRFNWDEYEHQVEIAFPCSGYPLTSTCLLERSIGDGNAQLARQNRELLLPAFARVRDALGLTPAQARWHRDDDDYGFHYGADEAEIVNHWIPRMNATVR
jgi:hypothetical protein